MNPDIEIKKRRKCLRVITVILCLTLLILFDAFFSYGNRISPYQKYSMMLTSDTVDTSCVKTETLPESFYSDGDKVAFIGDSITHRQAYTKRLEAYFISRYNGNKCVFFNKGVGGNTSADVINRIDGIFKTGANKATLMLGMNDMLCMGDKNTSENIIDENCARFHKNYNQLLHLLYNGGLCDIVLMSTSIYDDTSTMDEVQKRLQGYNNVLKRASDETVAVAAKIFGLRYIDINAKMLEANKEYQSINPANTVVSEDRKHPAGLGNWLITYFFLSEASGSCPVAETEIDVGTHTLNKALNCSISDLRASNTGVLFTYSPYSIPLAVTSGYMQANSLVPLTDDFNREIIRVKGLEKNAVYRIMVNGTVIKQLSGEELENGYNIGTNKNYINQQKALKLYKNIKYEDSYTVQDYERVTEQWYEDAKPQQNIKIMIIRK